MSRVQGIPPKRALASKESSLFKDLLAQYEARQLKKGLKTADNILKKYPEHGETLCMKGLLLVNMGKRDEGAELVKQGVRLDLTSHIVWHVYGLVQKSDKNYEEALKSYAQALKFDKDNYSILRDAAQLQAQLGLYDSLVETRFTILSHRPNLRQHWVGLAVAHHLNGNLAKADKVLEHYENTLKSVPDYDVEYSETLLYHIHILEQMGAYERALKLLDVNAKSRAIVDRTAIMEYRARLLSKLDLEASGYAWRSLIDRNAECRDYYVGYFASKNVPLGAHPTIHYGTSPEALKILQELSSQMPRARLPQRLALDISSNDEFRELAKAYLQAGLEKGIPSLFADLKPLYHDESKRQTLEELVQELRDAFSPGSSTSEPSAYIWALYYLGQHHLHLARYQRALEIFDTAISHTPSLPELYMAKARVLKRAGDPYGATRIMEDARFLDGQDRFLNTKSAKYRLRAGMNDEASNLLGLFTKKDAPSPGADLEEMQSMLYLVEDGDAHHRNGKLNLALKRYLSIRRTFDEIEDDLFDFHGYALRKFTLIAYTNMLSWGSRLRSHPAYVHAAIAASRIFIAVHDDPSIATALASGPRSGAEKKAKKKAKKAAQKQVDAKASAVTENGELPRPKDDDPDGMKALQCEDPLERAAKLLQPLQMLSSDKAYSLAKNMDVWTTIYDVSVRRKKYLQAVKALNHIRSIDAEHPGLHLRMVDLKHTVSKLPQAPPQPIGPALAKAVISFIPDEISLETFNSQYLQKHSMSAPAILACAEVQHKLSTPREDMENTVFTALGPDVHLSIEDALACFKFLSSIQSSRADEFRAACNNRFELATMFKTSEEQAKLRLEVLSPSKDKAENVTEVL
ncbi:N-terminal acetyltransferase A, auxiliary subunit [Fistulina hepatica ATCC 64428]|uniref:N-terminal acetyltransferase A, auxiliary subunit n=1 Tax=Fistulina hepatica ATCC 64428 TaxID=1128425 RepID=A0A0D7A1Z7_9AGAR|nr:N-terminal acetyltransferase A, auxiliary subunit [Fistulina hepatica ATCC 64428]